MAISPDITYIETGLSDNPTIDQLLPSLKDFFDSSITAVADSSNITSVDSNHGNGPNAQHFDLVSNTNSPTAFTVTPSDSNQGWHANLRYDSSEDTGPVTCFGFIDPNGEIIDATTSPPSHNFNAAKGTPDSEEGCWELEGNFWNNPRNVGSDYYVIEFNDAFIILNIRASGDAIKGVGFMGRIFEPWFSGDFGSGLGYMSPTGVNDGDGSMTLDSLFDRGNGSFSFQLSDQLWDTGQVSTTGAHFPGLGIPANWFNGNFMPGIPHILVPPNVDRIIGTPKYIMKANVEDAPGVVVDGGSATDWVYVGEDSSTAYYSIVPWDSSLTPVFL